MALLRIDKFLADAGVGTRSAVKELIKKGQVFVNGTAAKRPDIKINPEADNVICGGKLIQAQTFVYYVLNKPASYVSAVKDNTAPTVMSLINSSRPGLFPVGRLDKDTEGLLLITNDGMLSHRLLSPKHHVDKTYYAIVEGHVDEQDIRLFEEGLFIGDDDLNTALPARLSIAESYNNAQNLSYVHVTIQEGKFHQVKRMFQAVGKRVIYLKRTAFGGLLLPDDLPTGEYRELTDAELASLKE